MILVLKGVSLEVPEGKIVALLGANGAGKSTTLKAISNLLSAERGDVTKSTDRIQGKAGRQTRRRTELVKMGVCQVMEGAALLSAPDRGGKPADWRVHEQGSRADIAKALERSITTFRG